MDEREVELAVEQEAVTHHGGLSLHGLFWNLATGWAFFLFFLCGSLYRIVFFFFSHPRQLKYIHA